MSFLIFIDTNIFLDFYRVIGREKGLSILQHIDKNHQSFITGSQVEMEYKKNRQAVILEALKQIRTPKFENLSKLPAFLSQSHQSSGLVTSKGQIEGLVGRLHSRIGRVLKKPTQHDEVYRIAQRLFKFKSEYNLDRGKKDRNRIRHLARKRFALGYPPRKAGDTSIGDAVNWEWVIDCAIRSGGDIVIVSRDSDYGKTFDGTPILNDWLAQEFRERVGTKRKLILTDRLTDGLRTAGIGVTDQEAEAEKAFLDERATREKQILAPYSAWAMEEHRGRPRKIFYDLGDLTEEDARAMAKMLDLTLERVDD